MRGTVTIISPDGGGTRLTAEFPVAEPDGQHRPDFQPLTRTQG